MPEPELALPIATLLDALPDPACVIDDAGRVVACNAYLCDLLGVAREHVFGAMLPETVAQDTLRSPLGEGRHLVLVRRVGGSPEAAQRASRMDSVGQLTGGIAHDFNNLLAVVLGSLDLLRRRFPEDEKSQELIAMAHSSAQRGATLVRQLLAFARQQTLHPRPTDVNALVTGMLDLTRRSLRESIDVDVELAGDIWTCHIDPGKLESALLNLAINSRDAMPEGGFLLIETRNERVTEASGPVPPGSWVRLSVSDTGVGIPRAHLARVVEPFFTTKEAGQGTGLGLSMVYGFVTQSGGHLTIESEEGVGTSVRLWLPKIDVRADAADDEAGGDTPLGRGESVLVVEDDDGVRATVVAMLGSLDYVVHSVASASQAFEWLGRGEPVDLLVSDVVLAGTMGGEELARELLSRRPTLKVLFMSGYAAEARARIETALPGALLLGKPFRRAELARALRAALDLVDSVR